MSKKRLSYLLHLYFEDKASPEELGELLSYLDNMDNEEEIKSLMDNSWRDNQPNTPVFSAEKSKSMLAGVFKDSEPVTGPYLEKRRKWLYAAAAAIIVLCGSVATYRFEFSNSAGQDIAGSGISNSVIGPGSNKAVLTLSDKSTIVLDSANDGLLTKQGSTQIKNDNGQLAYILSGDKTSTVLFNTLNTPRGGQYQLILSDGSKVWLNAASSIRYPAAFQGEERGVEISGEAYFEVAKDPTRPFIVSIAGKGEVKVLGTRFNINAYGDEPSVKTSLLEGKVEVTSNETHNSKTIRPGQQVQLTAGGKLSLKRIEDMDQIVAWKNGLFNFSRADLPEVLQQVSRWYDVDIVFEGQVPQRQFEGEMPRNLNLSQILSILEKNNLQFRIENRRIIVLK